MAKKKSKALPEYENPPLTEVICGVTFQSLDNLTATHLGIIWSLFQSEFPRVEEVAPLASPIELIEGQTLEGRMEFTDIPPLPRQMFVSQDERNIIQVQKDRFLFNWRKFKLEDSYPRYDSVFDSFQKKLKTFQEFLSEGDIKLVPLQYELIYINQIPECEIWKNVEEIEKIFPNLSFKFEDSLILNEPENTNFRISFLLPDKLGRLHVNIKTGATRRVDNKKLVILELTARGISDDKDLSKMERWFDIAHEWIVKGFTDLTSDKMQKEVWKRRK